MLEAIPAAEGLEDLSREELSFLTFAELVSLSVRESDDSTGEALSDTLRKRRVDHENRLEYILPPLIFDSDHAFIAPFQIARPNFVTNLVVEGPSTSVSADKIDFDIRDRVEGRIVLIERADPGFDWLFSLNIVGLVTKYGGPNSHMAVRCAEFSIPAAIGCGENLYSKLGGDRFIVLDARSHSVVGY
jgi:phosphohistidine swiveling domain-containing protein